jgi:hypothetical protein
MREAPLHSLTCGNELQTGAKNRNPARSTRSRVARRASGEEKPLEFEMEYIDDLEICAVQQDQVPANEHVRAMRRWGRQDPL